MIKKINDGYTDARVINSIIYPLKGVISMSIFRESIIPRACLIQGAREIVDSGKLYVINKTGGSNSNNE